MHIPCFLDLIARADLDRMDVIVYGVLAYCDKRNIDPSVAEIALMIGSRCKKGHHRSIRARIAKLESKDLIRRLPENGKRTRFQILGPYFDNETPRAA